MRIITALLLLGCLFCACDPENVFVQCSYEYPVDVTGLSKTITLNDTIWINIDIQARLCLNDGILKNGEGVVDPVFYRLETDSLVFCSPLIVNFSDTTRNQYGELFYLMNLEYENERYQSMFGVVFLKPGIYAMKEFACTLDNGKDGRVFTHGYFKEEDNNRSLIPSSVNLEYWEKGEPNKYFNYFLEVTE